MITINIANEFSKTPGGRYREGGEYSGQEFRQEFLEPHFKNEDESQIEKIRIILDGGYGYATSFLEEAFGGLARTHGPETVLKHLVLVSEEEPELVNEIQSYIKQANGAQK